MRRDKQGKRVVGATGGQACATERRVLLLSSAPIFSAVRVLVSFELLISTQPTVVTRIVKLHWGAAVCAWCTRG